MTSVIEARAATKRYGEVLGLSAFTADFGPGITGLVGPNGAGKSTLFRVLTGQLRLDAGSVRVLGRDPWGAPPPLGDIGYCPEHPALYDAMTAEGFVEYLLRLDGCPAAEARTRSASALARVGLTPAAGRHLRGFSKGMRQRVKIAQAIALDARLLLLDEPLNGLDPLGRVQMLELFQRLASDGHHLVLSSHVLFEVEKLTNEIVLIANGRVLGQGNYHALREALDAHPHSVDFRTADPHRLARLLAGWEHVSALEIDAPDRLRVRTHAPDAFYGALPRLVVDEQLDVREMSSPDDNLEAVFRLLTRG